MKVLLVEDDPHISELVKLILLQKEQHNVVVTGDGEQALRELGLQSFDAIILDYSLPKMTGAQFYQQYICKMENHPPTLFLTACPDQPELIPLRESGVNVVEKPFTPKTLISALNDLFSEVSASAS